MIVYFLCCVFFLYYFHQKKVFFLPDEGDFSRRQDYLLAKVEFSREQMSDIFLLFYPQEIRKMICMKCQTLFSP